MSNATNSVVAGEAGTNTLAKPVPHIGRLDFVGYLRALGGIVRRELLRFFNQKERFFSALVRPLVWLFVFAVGMDLQGTSYQPPYQTYLEYNVYILPGLVAMIQLFNGMQSSLSMVYDREVGSMKVLLTSPYPRWTLLLAKLVAGVTVSLVQVYAFLLIAWFAGIDLPLVGFLTVLPTLVVSGMMLGAIGLFLSSFVKQLENFASVMNFVIFPMFFASSALRPLWRIRQQSEWLYWVCQFNPYSHAVEFIRFGLYAQIEPIACAVTVATTVVFFALAVIAYDPGRGLMGRRGGPAGETS
jgi:ABC-2 type transport system permease protein